MLHLQYVRNIFHRLEGLAYRNQKFFSTNKERYLDLLRGKFQEVMSIQIQEAHENIVHNKNMTYSEISRNSPHQKVSILIQGGWTLPVLI